MTPSVGAVTLLRPRLLRVALPRARALASWARAASRWARASSAPFWEMKPLATSCCWRSAKRSAWATRDSSRAISAASAWPWVWKSVGSISASSWPLRTRSPLLACTAITRPATSAPIFGSIRASRLPRLSSVTSRAMLAAVVVVISVAGGPAGLLAAGSGLLPQAPSPMARNRVTQGARRMVGAFGWVAAAGGGCCARYGSGRSPFRRCSRVSRSRITCTVSPSTSTSAARGRVL